VNINPIHLVPIEALNKINWFEGFKRLKRLARVILFLAFCVGVYDSATREPPRFTVEAKQDCKIITLGEGMVLEGKYFPIDSKIEFPVEMSNEKIVQVLERDSGTTFWLQARFWAILLLGGLVALELCFWIPVYILRGFSKGKS
jgi:hypothetical protein